METSNCPWDPSELFKIGAISDQITCVGYAPSKGRRCHNPIAAANRQEASNILSKLSRKDFMRADMKSHLMDLASRLLCRRYHQNQASTVTTRWLGEVNKLREEEMARRRLEEDTSSDRRAAILDNRRESEVRRRAPSTSSATTVRSVARSLPSSESQPLAIAVNDTALPQEGETTTAPPSTALNIGTLREANSVHSSSIEVSVESEIPANGSSMPITSENESSANGSDNHATPTAAEPEVECSICYEEITSESSIVSCRTSCKHNFHSGCMDTWFEILDKDGRTRTCPYCRSDWKRRSVEGDCSICCEALQDKDDNEDGSELVWCHAQCGKNFHSECMNPWLEMAEANQRVGSCPDCRADWIG